MGKRGKCEVANFTEEQTAICLESLFCCLQLGKPLHQITPFSKKYERWLGADALVSVPGGGFMPLYMQFKRPSAYPDDSRAKIVQDRKAMKPNALTTIPHSLFFGLREKKPEHTDYQHNILFRLDRRLNARNLGRAVYVCPLFLDRSAYLHSVRSSVGSGVMLWEHRTGPILHLVGSYAPLPIANAPILRSHICIPPHAPIIDARHSYSFSEDGQEVCFHSPERVPEGQVTLEDHLLKAAHLFIENQDARVTRNNARERLHELISGEGGKAAEDSVPIAPLEILDTRDVFAAWARWGDFLEKEYGIYQFIIGDWEQ